MFSQSKRIIAAILVVAMAFTNSGTYTFAASLQKVVSFSSQNKEETSNISHRYYEEFKSEQLLMKNDESSDNTKLNTNNKFTLTSDKSFSVEDNNVKTGAGTINNSDDIIRIERKKLELNDESDKPENDDKRDNASYEEEKENNEDSDTIDENKKTENNNDFDENSDVATASETKEENDEKDSEFITEQTIPTISEVDKYSDLDTDEKIARLKSLIEELKNADDVEAVAILDETNELIRSFKSKDFTEDQKVVLKEVQDELVNYVKNKNEGRGIFVRPAGSEDDRLFGTRDITDEYPRTKKGILNDGLFGADTGEGLLAKGIGQVYAQHRKLDFDSKYGDNYVFGAGPEVVYDDNFEGFELEWKTNGARETLLKYGGIGSSVGDGDGKSNIADVRWKVKGADLEPGDKAKYNIDAPELANTGDFQAIWDYNHNNNMGDTSLEAVILTAEVAQFATCVFGGLALGSFGGPLGMIAGTAIGAIVGTLIFLFTTPSDDPDEKTEYELSYVADWQEKFFKAPLVMNDLNASSTDYLKIHLTKKDYSIPVTSQYYSFVVGEVRGLLSWLPYDSQSATDLRNPNAYNTTGFYNYMGRLPSEWKGQFFQTLIKEKQSQGKKVGNYVSYDASKFLFTSPQFPNAVPASSLKSDIEANADIVRSIKKIQFGYGRYIDKLNTETWEFESLFSGNPQGLSDNDVVLDGEVPNSNGLRGRLYNDGTLLIFGQDVNKKIYAYEDASYLFRFVADSSYYQLKNKVSITNCTFDLTNLDFKYVTNLTSAFEGCSGTIIKNNWGFDVAPDCTDMFKNASFKEINLLDWSFPANATSMFEGARVDKVFASEKWDNTVNEAKATNFARNSNLVGQAGTKASNNNNITDKLARLDYGSDAPGLLWGSYYELAPGWYGKKLSTTITERDITKITISKYPTAPPDSYDEIWTLPGSGSGIEDGKLITCYLKGTEVTIYGPDRAIVSSGDAAGIESKIRFAKNSSQMFRGFENLATIEGLDLIETDQVEDVSYMFSGCKALTNIYLGQYTNLTNTSYMFDDCYELTSVDVAKLNTTKVTNMSHMFNNCKKLPDIDFRGFVTDSVTDMSYMFGGCETMQSIDLYTASSVTNMSYMFVGCKNVTTFNLSRFNTTNVTDMSHMFEGVKKASTLDLSSFNTEKVTNMSYMFANCDGATSINTSRFNTANVTNMSHMFENCANIENINLSNFNTGKVTDMIYMFKDCTKASVINVSSFTTNNVISTIYMFDGCKAVKELDLTRFDVSNVGRFDNMFAGCESLKTIKVDRDYRDWTNGKSSVDMFKNCKSIVGGGGFVYSEDHVDGEYARVDYGGMKPGYFTCADESIYASVKLYLPNNFYTSKKTKESITAIKIYNDKSLLSTASEFSWTYNNEKYYGYISDNNELNIHFSSLIPKLYLTGSCNEFFAKYSNVTEIDLSKLDTSEVNDMSYMFKDLTKLKSLDLSGFVTTSVGTMVGMFAGCTGLENLDLSNFNTQYVGNMYKMFDSCTALKSIKFGNNFTTANVTNMSNMFNNCENLESIDVSKFDTRQVNNMSNMFYGCKKINQLDLESFNTSNVTTVEGMFSECPELKTIFVSNTFVNTAEGNSVFAGDTNLKGGNGTEYRESRIDSTYARVDGGTTSPGYFTLKYILHKGDIFKNITASYDVINDIVFLAYPNQLTDIPVNTSAPSGFSSMTSMGWEDKGEIANTKGLRTYVGNRYYDSSRGRRHETIVIYAPTGGTIYLDEDATGLFKPSKSNLKVNQVYNFKIVNTSNTTIMTNMFKDVGADSDGFNSIATTFGTLDTIDLRNFDTSKVTTMESMFEGSAYTYVNLLDINTGNLTNTKKMFYNMSNLTTIYSNGLTDVGKINNSEDMFTNSSNLEGGAGTRYSDQHVDKEYARVDYSSIPGYFTSEYSTNYVLNPGWYYSGGSRGKASSEIRTIVFDAYPNAAPTSYNETWTLTNSNAGYDDGRYLTCYRNNDSVTIYAPARLDSYGNEINVEPKIFIAENPEYVFTGNGSESGNQFSSLARINNMNKLRFDTVKTASKVFYGCENLDSVEICGLNQVEEMRELFSGSGIAHIRFADSNTSRITNLDNMFAGLTSLVSVEFDGGFNTSNVTTMYRMFKGCTNLETVDVSNFDTTSLVEIEEMFAECSRLTNVTFGSNFKASNVTVLDKLFYKCASLSNVDLSSFDTSNVEYMEYLFGYCESLTSVNLSGLNTTKVKAIDSMFRECKSLKTLDLSSFKTSALTSMTNVFAGDVSLETINFGGNFSTSGINNFSSLFKDCVSLRSLDLRSFNTSNVLYLNSMFEGCKALETINVSSFNTSKVTMMNRMFYGCESLTSINLSNFDVSKVTTFKEMFYNCKALTDVDLTGFSYTVATTMDSMFANCESIKVVNLGSLSASSITNMKYMFDNCKALTFVNLAKIDTSSVKYMNNMFSNCESLTELNLLTFDTSNVLETTNMFANDKELKAIYASDNFTVTSVTNSDNMFAECRKLAGSEGTTFSESHIDKTYARIDRVRTNGTPGYFSNTYILHGGNSWNYIDTFKNFTENSSDRVVYDVAFLKYPRTIDDLPINTTVPSGFVYQGSTTNRFADKGEIAGTGGLKAYIGNEYRASDGHYHKTIVIYAPEDKKIMADKSLKFLFCPDLYDGRKTVSQVYGLDLIDTSNTTSMYYMFARAGSLNDKYRSIDDGSTDTTTLDLTMLKTDSVSEMQTMFWSAGYATINLTGFSAKSLTTTEGMFSDCANLNRIYATDDFDVSKTSANGYNMFYNAKKILGSEGTTYSGSYTGKDYARIDRRNSEGKPGYFSLEGHFFIAHEHLACGVASTSNPTCNHPGHYTNLKYEPMITIDSEINDFINGTGDHAGSSANMYLQLDTELTGGEITLTRDVYICLNGHSLKGTFKNSKYKVHITNCKREESVLKSDEALFDNANAEVYGVTFSNRKNVRIESKKEFIKSDNANKYYIYNANVVKSAGHYDLVKMTADNLSIRNEAKFEKVTFTCGTMGSDTTYYINNNNSTVIFDEIELKSASYLHGFIYNTGRVEFNGVNNLKGNTFDSGPMIVSTTSDAYFVVDGTLNVENNKVENEQNFMEIDSIIENESGEINIKNNEIKRQLGAQSILKLTGDSASIMYGRFNVENNKVTNISGFIYEVLSAVDVGKGYIAVGNNPIYIRNNTPPSYQQYFYGLYSDKNTESGVIYIGYGKTFSKDSRIDSIALGSSDGTGVICSNWNQAEDRTLGNTIFTADTSVFKGVTVEEIGDRLLLSRSHSHLICGELTHGANTHAYGTHDNDQHAYIPIPDTLNAANVNDFLNARGAYTSNPKYMYLTRDLELTGGRITLSRDVYICLNGHNLIGSFNNTAGSYQAYITNCKNSVSTMSSNTGAIAGNTKISVYGKKVSGRNNIRMQSNSGIAKTETYTYYPMLNGRPYLYNVDIVKTGAGALFSAAVSFYDITLEGVNITKTYTGADTSTYIEVPTGDPCNIILKDIKVTDITNGNSLINSRDAELEVYGNNIISNCKLTSGTDLIKVMHFELDNGATLKIDKNELTLQSDVEQSMLNVSVYSGNTLGTLEITNNKIIENSNVNTKDLSAFRVPGYVHVGSGSIIIKDNHAYNNSNVLSKNIHMYGLYSTGAVIFEQASNTKFNNNSKIDSIAISTSTGEGTIIENWDDNTAVDKDLYNTIFKADTYVHKTLGVSKTADNRIVIEAGLTSLSEHNATLYADGGEFTQGAATKVERVKYGDNILHFETPRRDGYTFNGYYVATNSTIEYLDRVWPYDDDADVHATWSAITYKLRFESNGGEGTMPDQNMTYGVEKNINDNLFTRDGYDFDGWTVEGMTNRLSDKAPLNNLTTKDGDIIYLSANWKGKKYTIKHDPNGGRANSSVVDIEATYGADTKVIADANVYERPGYSIVGWALSTNSEVVIDIAGNMPKQRKYQPVVTLYAKWALADRSTYGIIYLHGNGALINNAETAMLFGDVVTGIVELPDIKRKGYELTGFTRDALDGPACEPPFRVTSGAVRQIYTHWRGIDYNIAYHSNNGEYRVATVSEARDGQYTGRDNTFSWTKRGYKFVGWTKESNGLGQVYTKDVRYGELTDGEVIDLYAKWERENVTIKYDANGGVGSMADETFTYDRDQVISHNAYTRSGYVFSGWALSKLATDIKYVDGNSVDEIIADNIGRSTITLCAVWVDATNIANVEYDPNRGFIGNSPKIKLVKVVKGSGFVKVSARRKGHNQLDYVDASSVVIAEGSIVNADLRATANWQEKEYRVIYNDKKDRREVEAGPYRYEESFEIRDNIFSRNGYVLKGFDDESDAKVARYALNTNTISRLTEEDRIKLYAVWEGNAYKIRYNSNGALGVVADTDFRYGENVEVAVNTFIRSGKDAKGWKYTNSVGDVTYIGSGEVVDSTIFDVPTTGYVDLVAFYGSTKEKVRLDSMGGFFDDASETRVDYIIDGDPITFVEPYKSGYNFKNWYIEENGTKIVLGDHWIYGSDRTVKADWDPIQYSVVYESIDADKTSVMQSSGHSATYGKEFKVVPNKFERRGYDFGRWAVMSDDHTYTKYISNNATTSNLAYKEGSIVALKAKWTPKIVEVGLYGRYKDHYYTFGESGHSTELYGLKSSTITSQRQFNLPVEINIPLIDETVTINTPVVMLGWTRTPDSDEIAYVPEAQLYEHGEYKESINLISQMVYYSDVTGYINVRGNGGTVGGLTECQVPVVGDKVYWPEVVREGMKAIGWEVVGHKDMEPTAENLVNTDYVVQPIYEIADTEKRKYTIWYASNDGKYNVRWNKDIGLGSLDDSTEVIPDASDYGWSRAGYTFKGWSDTIDGIDGKLYKPGDPLKQVELDRYNEVTKYDTDKYLYAQWESKKTTVEYHFENYIVPELPHLLTYGTLQKLRENPDKKEGYVFMGWATTEGGEVVYTDREVAEDIILAENKENVPLYPVWAKEEDVVKVVYKGNGGTVNDVMTYTLPVMKGSEFKKLMAKNAKGRTTTTYKDENGNTIADGTIINSNILVYAKWN